MTNGSIVSWRGYTWRVRNCPEGAETCTLRPLDPGMRGGRVIDVPVDELKAATLEPTTPVQARVRTTTPVSDVTHDVVEVAGAGS